MKRRALIATGLAAGSFGTLAASSGAQEAKDGGAAGTPAPSGAPPGTPPGTAVVPATVPGGLVDSNASLGAWPFRRLSLDAPAALAVRLGALGVSEVWASSFEGLLHRDLRAVNARLAETCAALSDLEASDSTSSPAAFATPAFVPVGVLNPLDPAWEGDLARCLEEHGMRIVRLHPAWHGYGLDDPAFAALLDAAASAGVLVQVSVLLEDVRTQHPRVRVEEVDLAPLPDLLGRRPGTRVQLLNARLRGALLESLAAVPSLLFDTARTESTGGVRDLVEAAGVERVLFGSHAPFLIPEAALVRVGEADFALEEEAAVLGGNARRVLGRAAIAGRSIDPEFDADFDTDSRA